MNPPLRAVRPFLADDKGSVTAEYSVVVLAAVTLATVLMAIVNSDLVYNAISGLITRALSVTI